MPGGSQYPGPPEALAQYAAIVDGAEADAEVKGAKNPYTSLNGNMYSFITPEGMMALRLSDELGADFKGEYDSGEVRQYGSVMRGYVSVPDELFSDTEAIAGWFDRAHDWVETLDPK